mmetsp:Transcript_14952/g.25453  ORF Transcript_14952/g.25453 Transcript_14952/m.25453 type:complete len:504 (-) Transcript_14952:21-1532(-)
MQQKVPLQKQDVRDLFASFYQDELQKSQSLASEQEKRQERLKRYRESKARLDGYQKKPVEQLHRDYAFEEEVHHFSDFLQAQMSRKLNQVFAPHSIIAPENFLFFNQGRDLFQQSLQFREDLEDSVRFQLEEADLLQGFQVIVDVNSGFGSLAYQVTSQILKDEAPKAPVFIFSLSNRLQIRDPEEAADEEERTNLETRRELASLNQSLFASESLEHADLLVPFDKLSLGPLLKPYFPGFRRDLVYHESAVQSLVIQNIVDSLQKNSVSLGYDMQEFLKESLYAGVQSNVLLPQLQLPLQHAAHEGYLEKLSRERLTHDSHFVQFNNYSDLSDKRLPVRHTYQLRGASSLAGPTSDGSLRVFREQMEKALFKSTQFERGFKLLVEADPHYLPLPFPRVLDPKTVASDGLLAAKGADKAEFLQQMPSLQRLMLDGRYLGHCEKLHSRLKNLSMKTRFNLLRENSNMEEDDWRDKVYRLNEICETHMSLAVGDEPSDQGDDDDDY